MTADDIRQSRDDLVSKGPIRLLRFEGDPLCTEEKSECVHRVFNDECTKRVQEKTISGKGHSVLILNFVGLAGHPTRSVSENVIQYFISHWNLAN